MAKARILPGGRYRCDVCEGEGKVIAVLSNGKQETYECPQCKGKGDLERKPLSEEMREKAEEVARRRGHHAGGKYTISTDGSDAMLLFGKYNGQSVSQLMRSLEGRGYLDWMLKQEFAPELLDIVALHMGATRRR